MIGYISFLLRQGICWGLFLGLVLGKNARAYKRADAVMVRIYSDRLRVDYSTAGRSPRGLVVENKTLMRLLGKIESSSGKRYVSIPPGKYMSYVLDSASRDQSFTPLVPPLQRIELRPGTKSYEIPTKR